MEEYNERLTRGLAAGRRPLFVPGCWPVDRRLFVSVNFFHARHVRKKLSNPKPGHITGGARQGSARRSDGEVRDRTGRREIGSPRRQPSLLPCRASKTVVLNDSSEARTKKILCKPLEEQSVRLTTC